jgi:hypothetical protein
VVAPDALHEGELGNMGTSGAQSNVRETAIYNASATSGGKQDDESSSPRRILKRK